MRKRHVILLDILAIYLIMRVLSLYPLDLINIKEKEIYITNVEGVSNIIEDYHIFTTDGAYLNRNSTFLGKFNHEYMQAHIFKKHEQSDIVKCKVITGGPRFSFAGQINYTPNILKINCYD